MTRLPAPTEHKAKYYNEPTRVDGYYFPSKGEAARYKELRLLERAGEITDLQVHPRFELSAFGLDRGAPVPVATYVADFSYRQVDEKAGRLRLVVEDYKSTATITQLYKLKKRWMKAQYGVEVQEITTERRRRRR